jgi:hypothetical protein
MFSSQNLHDQEVIFVKSFLTLRRCLEGLARPFFIPGSEVLFLPQIYVTVIAQLPFRTTTSEQVIVQGACLSEKNLDALLSIVAEKLNNIERLVAEDTGVFTERIDKIRVNDRSANKDIPVCVCDPCSTDFLAYLYNPDLE